MTDFLQLLVDMRSGAVAQDINAKFNDVLSAVLDTGGKGELTVKIKFAPSSGRPGCDGGRNSSGY